MKLVAIFFSPTKSTERYIQSIVDGMGLETELIDITQPANRETVISLDQQIVLLGFPVYGMRIPQPVMEYLNRLDGNGNLLVAASVFGNVDSGIVDQQIVKLAQKKNFRLIGTGSFVAQHTFSEGEVKVGVGRPDRDDLLFARNFGERVRTKIEAGDQNIPAIKNSWIQLFVEKAPYGGTKRVTRQPKVSQETCSHCMRCVKKCPVNAIDGSLAIDETKCLRCMSCVKNCAAQARQNRFKLKIFGNVFMWMGRTRKQNQYHL